MSNPNEYDDDAYGEATGDLHRAVEALWDAGAEVEDIENELDLALDRVVA